MKKIVSIVVPIYNEEKVIKNCLDSLNKQTYKSLEIILVDDGSNDKTLTIVSNLKSHLPAGKAGISNLKLLRQNHKGPGPARNLGAASATGEILVFIDADMTFERNFIRDLVNPIIKGQAIGTFSKNELVSNKDNPWSVCWNINRNVPKDRMLPLNYPDEAPVFRAIFKKEFDKVGGFDATGEYTDDWSLSRKLKVKSTLATGAIYYHSNPASPSEIWKQARWIGKNEFIAGSLIRQIRSLIFYSLPFSLIIGLAKSLLNINFYFLFFKLIYDFAILSSVIKSFTSETKAK